MESSAGGALRSAAHDLPECLRGPVMPWLDRFLRHEPAQLDRVLEISGFTATLLKLVACSEFAAVTVAREWNWFAGKALAGQLSARPDLILHLEEERGGHEPAEVMRLLRQFRNRRLLHILWRELAGAATVADTLSSLTELADRLIAVAARQARTELHGRFGVPRDGNGREQHLVVLAMGKLGGKDLNFSSDIDLIFLYPGEGETDGERRLSAEQYFTRLSRRLVALLDEATPDGFVYRVDTRLRPFGDSGPAVVSFGALESYLVRHGRSWERYAYVKARVVDTDGAGAAGREVLEEIIQPFVFRRYLDYGVFESLREIKALIVAESRKRQLQSNIKIGPGGIREIEFIVQSLQLVRGGSDRKLRRPELKAALQHLGRTRNLKAADAASLGEAYAFLRRLENFIQALRDRQSHDLPDDTLDRARLALAMGFPGWDRLAEDVERHRAVVHEQFTAAAFRGAERTAAADPGDAVTALWVAGASEEEWKEALAGRDYAMDGDSAAEIARLIVGFAASSSVGQVGKAGSQRLRRFMPAVLAALEHCKRPAVALQRVLQITERILRRSAYVALLIENPVALDRLVSLCDTSAWLAEEIGRYPLLLDELLDPRLYTAPFRRADMQADLDRRLAGLADRSSEQQVEMLAQFQRAAVFRIAVADVTGNLPIMKVSDRLTELAEVVLNRALAIAWRDLFAQHGRPRIAAEGGPRYAGFGVIAYGKFGGMELSYRSDLDLVFLHDGRGADEATDGPRPLENSMFFGRLVRRLVHFLTVQTSSGPLYQVDTRLRPSGRSGLLVTSIDAFERYQEENAWTWEHQALLRSRPVAGTAAVAREFERIRAETLRHRVKRGALRADVASMREKMRKQLDKSDAGHFDLKQGPGGIADIEFIVQYLVLENAERRPAVIHYTDNIRQLGTLGAAGCLDEPEVVRLQEIYKSYRLRLHRLALDEKPPFAGVDEFEAERSSVIALRDRVLHGAG